MRQLFRHLEVLHAKPLVRLAGHLSALVAGRLWLKVLIGMLLGLAVGVVLGPSAGFVEPEIRALAGNWLALPGMLFLAAVQMIVIPLIFASIILGLASSENVDVALLMGVDRILDMSRTSVNVAGDLVASKLMDRWVGDSGPPEREQ